MPIPQAHELLLMSLCDQNRKETTLERIPINSNLFKDKDAMPKPQHSAGASGTAPTAAQNSSGMPQYPPINHFMFPPGGAYTPFPHMAPPPGYIHPAYHGQMAAYGQPPPPGIHNAALKDMYTIPSSSPPPGCAFDDYCVAAGHDNVTKSRLEALRFMPGDRLGDIPGEEYTKVGFKYLEWQRILKADRAYRKHAKR